MIQTDREPMIRVGRAVDVVAVVALLLLSPMSSWVVGAYWYGVYQDLRWPHLRGDVGALGGTLENYASDGTLFGSRGPYEPHSIRWSTPSGVAVDGWCKVAERHPNIVAHRLSGPVALDGVADLCGCGQTTTVEAQVAGWGTGRLLIACVGGIPFDTGSGSMSWGWGWPPRGWCFNYGVATDLYGIPHDIRAERRPVCGEVGGQK